MDLVEPTSYADVVGDVNWIEAMDKEIIALLNNNTWDFVLLPKGKKAIGCKWAYMIKKNVDGLLKDTRPD